MRLTKFNPETGEHECATKAKTLTEFRAQRKAVIQKLGELEDGLELGKLIKKPIELVTPKGKTIQIPKWEYREKNDEQR